jgi:hypothetical protein
MQQRTAAILRSRRRKASGSGGRTLSTSERGRTSSSTQPAACSALHSSHSTARTCGKLARVASCAGSRGRGTANAVSSRRARMGGGKATAPGGIHRDDAPAGVGAAEAARCDRRRRKSRRGSIMPPRACSSNSFSQDACSPAAAAATSRRTGCGGRLVAGTCVGGSRGGLAGCSARSRPRWRRCAAALGAAAQHDAAHASDAPASAALRAYAAATHLSAGWAANAPPPAQPRASPRRAWPGSAGCAHAAANQSGARADLVVAATSPTIDHC